MGLTYNFAPALCATPQNASYANSTQTSSQLTWSVPGGGGTFNVEYGASGFQPGTGTVLNGVSSGVQINGLTTNTTYHYYVRQTCGINGNSALVGPIVFKTGTIGEDCSTAPLISVATSQGACNFTTVTSGVSSNGPNAICSDINGNGANDDTWLKFVAPNNGSKVVITTTAGTVNDWVMEVWNGCPGAGMMLKCADDVNGAMPEITLCQNEYVGGQTYYIRIWTYSIAATGTANLCVYRTTACPLPPVNDECISAVRLTVNPPLSCPGLAQTFSNSFATPSGDGATCDAGNKNDVWFVFNTGNYDNIVMTISPGTATTLKAQLLFECGGFEISCYSPANGTYVFSGLNPQADYIIRVWSDTLTSGTFSICLADQCANPTATFSANQAICNGNTATVPVTFTGVAPFTFTYKNNSTNVNTPITTSQNPYQLMLNPTATTSYSMVSMSDAACSGTATNSVTITVVNQQTVTLNPFNPVCVTAPDVTLTGGSPAGGAYSGVGVSAGKFDPSVGTQTITYTVTFAPGCVGSASQVFTVNQLPTVVFNSLGNICSTAAPFTLNTATPSGRVYSGSGVSGNVFNPASAGLGTKILTYTYTGPAGCVVSDTALVNVINCSGCSVPPIANAGADVSTCSSGAVQLSGSISGSATSAFWVSNGTGTFSPNMNNLNASYNPSAQDITGGLVRLILTTNDPDGAGPCIAHKDTMFIAFSNSVIPQLISGTGGVCRPVNGVPYSVPSQVGLTYLWTVPTNVVIASGQGTNSITANWPSNGQAGDVCVTISSGCDSYVDCKNVKLRTILPGSIPAIIGETSACKNETFPYSIAGIGTADFYEWTPPSGATVNGSSSPIVTTKLSVILSFNSTYAGDSIKVRGGNCIGYGPYKSMMIAKRTTPPNTPGTINGVKFGVCGTSQVYYIKPVSGATSYRWKCLQPGVLINGLPSPVIIPDTIVTITWPTVQNASTIYVAAKNGCGTGTERSLNVKTRPAQPTFIDGPQSVCVGSSATYSTDPIYGATSYFWKLTSTSGAIIQSGQGTEVANIKFNSAGTEKVKVRAENACALGYYFKIIVTVTNCPRFGEVTDFNSLGMEAYPNPTSDLINISFTAPKDENYRMVLVDLMGRIVKEESFAAQEGINQLKWDMSPYLSGMYIMTIQSSSGKSQVRIVVE
ncbi:MAG: T9SS type A sorting domain-containing protein [Bacteroidetes bacterium]|nr:T9SS type A sorting domain-containing protein [Bacteroidota bacterium]